MMKSILSSFITIRTDRGDRPSPCFSVLSFLSGSRLHRRHYQLL